MTRSLEDLYSTAVQEGEHHHKRNLLMSNHTAAATARPTIAHAQLRHLISCPQRRGIVYYVSDNSIVERDLLNPHSPARCIIQLDFRPTCLAVTAVACNSHQILFAAGGFSSDMHLSLHSFPPSGHSSPSSPTPPYISPKLLWKHVKRLRGQNEIVNSIFFSPASLTDDTRWPTSDIRMTVSGNDMTVKFFDIGLEPSVGEENRMQPCGSIRLDTCVNHVSISPDGCTLLCVGDTPRAYLFRICPGSNLTFFPLATYTLPAPPVMITPPTPSFTTPPLNFRSHACFTTAWSADGLKFAIASQEGQLCVWDVRSATPLYTFWTQFRRNSNANTMRNRLGEWEWEDLGGHLARSDDLTNNGPDSGIRNVRFSAGDAGRELMVFTEHTTNLHVIDARTFDPASHSVIPFPDLSYLVPPPATPIPITPPAHSTIRPATPTERSHSPVVIPAPRSRTRSRAASRSRSPPAPPSPPGPGPPSPSYIIVPDPPTTVPIPPLSVSPPTAQPVENYWSAPDAPDPSSVTRERLDADGDVIPNIAGDRMVARWASRPRRPRAPPPAIDRHTPPLESVSESVEPATQSPIHIAGVCFDPSGGWVYVAGDKGIVEWRVKEREEGKTCWASSAWA